MSEPIHQDAILLGSFRREKPWPSEATRMTPDPGRKIMLRPEHHAMVPQRLLEIPASQFDEVAGLCRIAGTDGETALDITQGAGRLARLWQAGRCHHEIAFVLAIIGAKA